MICYAKLDIEISVKQLQQEIGQLLSADEWRPHYNQKHYDGDWNVLPLRTPGGDIDKPFAELMNDNLFMDTEVMRLLSSVEKMLNEFHCEKLSVRLLNLKTGAVIKEHRDYELAFEHGEARLHIPVFTNNKVEFYVDGDIVSMKEGECWYINANLPHRVANKGTADRIHLVIDCKVNNWLKKVLEDAEKKCMDEVQDRGLQMNIIQSLRMHGTEASNMLADKMERELNE
ncbi:MAG: aspartyl/asparaginyl beta-hydroxylase domain-containing protein [Bacteroidetes bacterium]|jgi:mannose-6-phosphate isomerase-like protein (cupin superfamily)|nr:aspartyl/asparaginyl beta-hydroxylase domain-containing protein [Bacteroidota bacterium]